MKKLVLTTMAFACFALSGFAQDVKSLEKKIIGKWVNPYTYEYSGELKGFEFKKGGKCKAINVPDLELKTWKIDKEGYLIIEGIDTESGHPEKYITRERINLLNSDSLEVIAREKNPQLVFLYINKKVIKKLVKPGKVVYDESSK